MVQVIKNGTVGDLIESAVSYKILDNLLVVLNKI